jgi:RNA ligase (TIGR02306 family)
MSKLIVEVCPILQVSPHENADRLDVVTVKGWNCIVGKGQYKVDDLAIFVPPESIVPSTIIEKYNLGYLKKNGRVGTIKLRKVVSQGLILDLPTGKKYKEGDNVAEELGITKYEPPEPSFSVINNGKRSTRKHRNPLFDVYTDIENIKHFPNIFTEEDEVVITEKIHGTNFRTANLELYEPNKLVAWIKKYILKQTHEFCYGSHRVQIYGFRRNSFYGEDIYGKTAEAYKLKDKIPQDYIIYGEIYGPGIQDLTYGYTQLQLRFFDVKYKDKYLSFDEFIKFCNERSLPTVPVLYKGKFSQEILKQCTEGNTLVNPTIKQFREGCVIKSLVETNHPTIGRKVLKSINTEYLTRPQGTENH